MRPGQAVSEPGAQESCGGKRVWMRAKWVSVRSRLPLDLFSRRAGRACGEVGRGKATQHEALLEHQARAMVRAACDVGKLPPLKKANKSAGLQMDGKRRKKSL
mgnify:CR=1 FL=1